MSERSIFRSMLGLHAWAGLLLGWASFLIFLTGTLAYFQAEITQWMQPSLQHAPSSAHAMEAALERLRIVAPRAAQWIVRLPSDRDPSLRIVWKAGAGERSNELLNAATGQPARRIDTLGGRLFYSFHFTFMLPGVGYWIAGAAAMFMLVAIVTGLVIHRKIFADFFAFRPAQSPRRSWLDAHNLSSLFALPFHIAIVYTGLITLMYSYMPMILATVYGDDSRAFFREAFVRQERVSTEDPVTIELPLGDLAHRTAQLEADGYALIDATVDRPTDPAAMAALSLQPNVEQTLPFGRSVRISANVHDVLYEFHLAQFVSWTIRWLLFASGLLGSAMIATGLIVWTLKRRDRAATSAARAGCFVVERLNVGVVAGSLLAVAAYLLANRLIPGELEDRELWELRTFFVVWAATIGHPFFRPALAAWREQLWIAAAAFGALPIVSGALTGRDLFSSIGAGDGVFVGVEVAMLMTAGAAAFAAWRVSRREADSHAAAA